MSRAAAGGSPRVSDASVPTSSAYDLHRTLVEWNSTNAEYPRTTIHRLFERRAVETPQSPALLFGDSSWSYGQLNRRANRLARHLLSLGAEPESLIGLAQERGPEMIASLLAILKVGGTYLPLDPEYPAERLRFMLEDTGARLILSQPHLQDQLPIEDEVVICAEELDLESYSDADLTSEDGTFEVGPDHLAYVIYTSGSTGRPKGVAIPHRGVMRLLFGGDYMRFGPQETFLVLSPISFDLSTFEIWGALLHGGRLALYPPGKLEIDRLGELLSRMGVTTAWLTAGLFHQVVDQAPEALRPLSQLLAGGDILSVPHVRRALEEVDGHLINGYGPTESTTFASCHPMTRGTTLDGSVPIGKPIGNTQLYVLSPAMQPLPIGEVGELMIGGDGLARCYLGRPALTAERFVPDPFGGEAGARLYHSGDLASWTEEGVLKFHGRFDHQIKLRGFRIELGEIETELTEHPEIGDATVIARQGVAGSKSLVAYLVPQGRKKLPTIELHDYLAERLPAYMLPAFYVYLDEMPLNANGKVDRRALPDAVVSRPDLGVEYLAPRDDLEERLAVIWGELLGVDAVGVEDDFLQLGGHSLLIGRLLWRLREDFSVELDLADIYARPTIARLAPFIVERQQEGAGIDRIEPAPRDQPLPLSFPQERIWFLEQLMPHNLAYNSQATIRFRGELRIECLEASLTEIVRRHEIFCTSFVSDGDQPVQVIHPPVAIRLPVIDLSGLDETVRERRAEAITRAEFARHFDLDTYPLARWRILRMAARDHILVQSEHHFVHDGWSIARLLGEIEEAYPAFAEGRRPELPELPIQYADFAAWQRRTMQGERLESLLAYWRQRLAGSPPALDLPTDHPRPPQMSFIGKAPRMFVEPQLGRSLRQLSRERGVTLFTVMISGFNTLLMRYSGDRDILVGMAVANRTRPELEPLIGMVVKTVILRTDLSGWPSYAELMERVHERAREAYLHQDVPLGHLVEDLAPERDLSRNPLFQVMFSFHDSPVPDLIFSNLRGEVVIQHNGSAKTDLNIIGIPRAEQRIGRQPRDDDDAIELIWEYSTDLFEPATIERMIGHYFSLLRAAVDRPEQDLWTLPLLSEAEQAELRGFETAPVWSAPSDDLVHRLVARHALERPDELAISSAEGELSYGQLVARARGLARHLGELGVARGDLVAVCLERRPELLVTVLAALELGACYLPIDPTYPAERRIFMIEDSRARLCVAQRSLAADLALGEQPLFLVDDLRWHQLESGAEVEPVAVTALDLAYVIYTSGSTGVPKGIEVSHGALSNLVRWHLRRHPFQAIERATLTAGLGFDAAVWEIWPWLAAGACLHLPPEDVRLDPTGLRDWLLFERITSAFAPTPMAERLLELQWPGDAALKALFTGGDKLHLRPSPEAPFELINLYGPAENTAVSTTRRVPARTASGAPSIGRPIDGGRCYVVGRRLAETPVGIPGELHVAGAGVARGYRARPTWTAERFVPDLAGGAGERMYRTGDRVRWRADGRLEFLGRVDHQVKVRGFRIELGEIEAALAAAPGVREGVVVLRSGPEGAAPDGEKSLAGYLLIEDPATFELATVRDFLAERLPHYMMPSAFGVLETWPLTANGKIDRRALPDPEALDRRAHGRDLVTPRTPVEEVVAELWSELLGRQGFSIHESFFDLGGHSLLATRAVARLRQSLQIELPLSALFDHPSVADMAAHIERQWRGERSAVEMPPLVPRDEGVEPRASFAQERLWFLDRLLVDRAAYNIPLVVHFSGPLDADRLQAALLCVRQRHEVLRTTFPEVDGQPRPVVQLGGEKILSLVEVGGSSAGEVLELARRAAREPFDLERGPLLRALLLRTAEERHHLVLVLHHIVADGWSVGLLLREAAEIYRAELADQQPELPALPIQYADYALWQRRALREDRLASDLEFWRRQLGPELPAALELPTDRPRPATQSHHGDSLLFSLEPELVDRLGALGRERGASLFMSLMASFSALLYRYTGQRDFTLGTPIAGRQRLEIEPLIGFFVNTLVLRTPIDPAAGFGGLLAGWRQTVLQAFAHQELPFEKLVEALQPDRSLDRHPLFQVLLALEAEAAATGSWPDLEVELELIHNRTAKFDLSLVCQRRKSGIDAYLMYSTDLFDRATIARLARHWQELLRAVSERPEAPLDRLSILAAAEREQILYAWNETRVERAQPASLHRLFAEQAARSPERVAVAQRDLQLSYLDVAQRSNRLAAELCRRGAGPESRVGLWAERSPEMVIALLATLEAGAAYVPLDPDLPDARLAFIAEDAGLRIVISDLQRQAPFGEVELIELGETVHRPPSIPSPSPWIHPENAAYAIYTSGSTGRPKGVLVSQRSVIDHALSAAEEYGLGDGDRLLQFAALAFDMSVDEIFPPLARGATLVLRDETMIRSSQDFLSACDEQRITVIDPPAAFWHELCRDLAQDLDLRVPPALRLTVLGGEQLQAAAVATWLRAATPDHRLLNAYGPTEATVTATWSDLSRRDLERPIPIGRPLPNHAAYVLDARLEPLPVGVYGELCLTGAGLARGYLGRPAMTAAAFVPDPFGEPGERLYRSGDRVRWLLEGALQFGGRIDDQVKIRGFRIEPGEIESQLENHPRIRQAVVTIEPSSRGESELVGYVAVAGDPPGIAELRTFLADSLPRYMVPGAFCVVDAFPVGPTGKIDRRALAAQRRRGGADGERTEPASTAPRTPLEASLAAIWSELLDRETIDVDSDFFTLGGHSLLAARVVSRLQARHGVEVSLRTFFNAPTVAELARVVAESKAVDPAQRPALVKVPRRGDLPPSFAQDRLWFLDQMLERREAYNILSPLRLHGEIELEAVKAALEAVIARHETLRTTFVAAAGQPWQRIRSKAHVELPLIDLSALDRPAAVAEELLQQEALTAFDLERGPLLRARLLRLAEDEHHLLITVHHIVADGGSMPILRREFSAFYRAALADKTAALPPLPVQYADYAVWQRRWLSGQVLAEGVETWRQRLADAPALLELPTDRPRPPVMGYRGTIFETRLGSEVRAALQRVARQTHSTLFLVLASTFQLLLARLSGQRDLAIGLPVAGRDQLEIEELIGLFVNTLVLRSDLDRSTTPRALVSQVRREFLDVMTHQEIPFEKLVEALQPERSLAHAPLVQVMFAFHRQVPEDLNAGEMEITLLPVVLRRQKFDLSLACEERADGVHCVWGYDSDLFDRTTIRRWAQAFETLLAGFDAGLDQDLDSLPWMTPAARHQLLNEWNDGPDAAAARTLDDLFVGRADAVPERIAMIDPRLAGGNPHLSFGEIERRSRALAAELIAAGVEPETCVAVCGSRSLELCAALLGVLRSGGAYVALDPTYPTRRLSAMLEDLHAARSQDAAPPVVLCDEQHWQVLPDLPNGTRLVDLEPASEPTGEALGERRTTPEQLAYVLYTSGSTGRPKGVAITHRSASALLHWARRSYGDEELSGVLAATSINFDLSVFELFAPLAWGGTAILAEDALALADDEQLRASRIRLLNTVPSAAAELLQLDAIPTSVTTLDLAGEPLHTDLVRKLHERPGIERVVDLYGPSEDTTYSTWATRGVNDPETIGRPIDGSRAYVFDPLLRLSPIGILGELCLAGEGLARGYLQRPALTAASFVPEPFSSGQGGARLYRTGDLARFLPDGRLQFAGRLDRQVKVRGFRIELGEIEVRLMRQAAIREAVVVVRDDDEEPRLVAYLVPERQGRVETSAVRSALAAELPEYMVPGQLAVLGELPRLPNGKVDRQALPAPQQAASEEEQTLRGPVEDLLAGVWCELLGVGRVSARDHFFSLGGHSLLAARMIARLRSALAIEVPIKVIFDKPVLAELAADLEDRRRQGQALLPLDDRVERDDELRLSFSQERLWFLDRLLDEKSVYNLPSFVALEGPLDLAALISSWRALVERHESLRTVFPARDGQPYQVVRPLSGSLPVIDLRALDDRRDEARRLQTENAWRVFDLEQGPLLRAVLVRLASERVLLLVTQHHIISDGWSIEVMWRDLSRLYCRTLGEPAALPPLTVQAADLGAWQRRWLRGENLEAQLAYWRDQLADAPPLLELLTDRPRPAVQGYRGARVRRSLAAALRDDLARVARGEGATLFMLLLASLQALLARHAGSTDISVGSPVAGRRHPESEGLIGFFVNTLVLRSRWSGDPRFRELLEQARSSVLDGFAHQDLPFEKLVEAVQPERSLSHAPLFQVLFVMRSGPQVLPDFPGVVARAVQLDSETTKFDLSFACAAETDRLDLLIEYDRDLLDATTAQRYLTRWESVLRALTGGVDRRLSALLELAPAERQQVAVEWNDAAQSLDGTALLHQPIVDRMAQTPDAVALTFGDSLVQTLTYGALERRSSDLAAYLQSRGVGPESVVGLLAERSLELVVGLLAILRAGGAYLPIDPSYPRARQHDMIGDALGQGGVLLGSRQLLDDAEVPAGIEAVALDRPAAPGLTLNPPPLAPENLAYLIYTSGSTGRPKAAMNSHRGIVNRLRWKLEHYALSAEDRFLQKTPSSFDVSVWEFFAPLWLGARLAIALPDGHRDSAYLRRTVIEERITTLHFVPSMLGVFLDQDLAPATALRRVLSSGEALSFELQQRFFERLPAAELHNLYGPTEAAIDVSWWTCRPGESVPIGRPVANTRLHILDRGGREVGPGIPGQLYLGGVQVGRGYFDRPRLTAAAFVPDPFAATPGARLYATGDLASWRADGAVQYLGRIDHQVKVRGLRIELGEIEAHLQRLDPVLEAVVVAETVLAQTAGESTRLEAHLVLAEGFDGNDRADAVRARDLRRALAEVLPAYMVPDLFHAWSELPRLPNGKIDRRALAQPSPNRRTLEALEPGDGERVPTPSELMVEEIFRDLLGTPRAGLDVSFFSLGGHSLLATQLMSRISSRFGVELPLRTLFERPTVAGLAAAVEEAMRSDTRSARPPLVALAGERGPLSFSQERLWFLDRLQPGSAAYNIPMAWRLRATLDPAAIEAAHNAILARHQVLRTRFPSVGGEGVQQVRPWVRRPLALIDLSALPAAGRDRELRRIGHREGLRPFDLGADRDARTEDGRARDGDDLLRLSLVRLADEDHVLLATLHHIAGDGWSVAVWQRELAIFYEAAAGVGSGPVANPLPPLPVQYLDYAVWQRAWLRGEVLADQVGYWRRQLEGAPPLLELPADRPRPTTQSDRGASVGARLSPELSARLHERASAIGATPFMLLMAAFKTLLWRYSAQSDLVVGSPIAGRTQLETEELIGFFLNNLALRTDLGRLPGGHRAGFATLVEAERQVLLGAYAYQDLPFEKLVEELQPERALSYSPIYQVMLNLHNWNGPSAAEPTLAGHALEWMSLAPPLSKLDLSVHLEAEPGGGFRTSWIYRRDLFDRTTIARLVRHFERLLEAALAAPERSLHDLPLLTASEEQQTLVEWNDTAAPALEPPCLHHLFAASAARHPQSPALISGDTTLSYAQLERASRTWALRMRDLGVGPEVRVGLHLERSVEAVIGVLAVLRAGGAYVALDPELPAPRLALMLEDSRAEIVITRAALSESLGTRAGTTVLVDQLSDDDGRRTGDLDTSTNADHLAYLVYTSGTTGRPKAVMAPHRGAVSFIRHLVETFDLRPGDRALQLAAFGFDASVRELFAPLSQGGCVVLAPPRARRDPAALLDLIADQRVDAVLSAVPSLLRTLLDFAGKERDFSSLRLLMTSGERLFASDVERAFVVFGSQLEIVNQYGPTEATMVASHHRLRAGESDGRPAVLIGRPKLETRFLVLGPRLEPCPIGVVGELYLATPDLARGYLDRPAQTAELFVPDPYATQPGTRMYATGDRVRALPSGELDFIGRHDDQVKVLGNRVELGEVEIALERHPAVARSAVLAWQPKPTETRLVAYVETVPGERPNADALRAHLAGYLPEYMLPALWMFQEVLPLNPNGKVDRRALPAPSEAEVGRADVYLAPRTPVETLLEKIWNELLAVEQIGVYDNFFDLGGHSLDGLRAIYRLQELLAVDIEARALFEAQTIEELAPWVEEQLLEQIERLDEGEAWADLERRNLEPILNLRESVGELLPEKDLLRDDLAERLLRLPPVHLELRALRLEQALERGSLDQAIPQRENRKRAPLSWIQEAFWFIEQREETNSVYRSTHQVALSGEVDPSILKRSLNAMAERHEIMRTRFDVDGEGRTYQEILPTVELDLPEIDLRGLDPETVDPLGQALILEGARAGFDLRRLPLIRLLLLRLDAERSVLLLVMHHIITDNWSMGAIFFQELSQFYNAFASGRQPTLPELSIQYADYAAWERERLQDEVMERLMDYWSEKLAGGIPQMPLATDRPRPEHPSYKGSVLGFEIDEELTEALVEFSRGEQASLFMILLAGYKILLARHSRQPDILVATPNANRSRRDTEKLLGCFANMLLLRTDLSGDPSLRETIHRVKETALGAFTHQDMPFMVALANFPPQDFAYDRSPFQASFTLLNAPSTTPAFEGLNMDSWRGVNRGATDQELALWMVHADRLYGVLLYDLELFDRSTVARLSEEYRTILAQIVRCPDERLSKVVELAVEA